jgi:hypothetical protein
MRVDLAGAKGDETIARISAQAARAAALQAKASNEPRSRKVVEGLDALEREVAGLETAVDRISAAVEAAYAAVDDATDLDADARELDALQRQADAVAATASALRDRIASARDTLAQLEEVGVLDAVEDDRALEELTERVQASEDLVGAALEFIDAARDELAERRALEGTLRDDY